MSEPEHLLPTLHSAAACIQAWNVLRLAHERVAQRVAADLARECALSISEFDVLFFLHSYAPGEARIGALQEATTLSQPALSRLVARLEGRGLLRRDAAIDDGRSTLIGLTDAGVSLVDRAVTVHAQAVQEVLTSKFSLEEQAILLRTLRQIAD